MPLDALLPPDSPRVAGLDEQYALALAGLDARLPPILVQRSTMRVVDGAHRLRAARLRRDRTIEVEFFDGTDRESFVRAVEANLRHGLPLTLPDRRAAAGRIVRAFPEWSDRAVAAAVRLSSRRSRRSGRGIGRPAAGRRARGTRRPGQAAESGGGAVARQGSSRAARAPRCGRSRTPRASLWAPPVTCGSGCAAD